MILSRRLQRSFDGYGTWLLSQAFSEGSPVHPPLRPTYGGDDRDGMDVNGELAKLAHNVSFRYRLTPRIHAQ